ncbi:MAG: alpha/beta hydrolase [Ferruginibacter sp.]
MKYFFIVLILLVGINASAQKLFNLWPGAAPGAESWSWPEGQDTREWVNDTLAYNVTRPTLTFYPADPALANGTIVLICPGGSFSYLHINTEGADVARWLNKKGVSAMVLKYRLVHSFTNQPVKEKNLRMKDSVNARRLYAEIVPMAIADAKEAVTWIRKHAGELGVAPTKIGIMGFSAGGTLATANAFNYTKENRPDFVMSIYAYIPPELAMTVPNDAPPLFIAAASDDELHLVPMSLDLYKKWLIAGHSAEIHVYSKGGHGFGMNKNNQPSDSWIERLGDWLQVQGLLNK